MPFAAKCELLGQDKGLKFDNLEPNLSWSFKNEEKLNRQSGKGGHTQFVETGI